jgi:hypothetical protein
MDTTEYDITDLTSLNKIRENKIQDLLKLYSSYSNIEAYAKLTFIVFPVLFLIHNLFIAGNSYPIDTYDNIKTTELTIVVIVMAIIIAMAIKALMVIREIKYILYEQCKQKNLEPEKLGEEFSAFAVALCGGEGVKLKNKNV